MHETIHSDCDAENNSSYRRNYLLEPCKILRDPFEAWKDPILLKINDE